MTLIHNAKRRYKKQDVMVAYYKTQVTNEHGEQSCLLPQG